MVVFLVNKSFLQTKELMRAQDHRSNTNFLKYTGGGDRLSEPNEADYYNPAPVHYVFMNVLADLAAD
jgi:hypothetical protein